MKKLLNYILLAFVIIPLITSCGGSKDSVTPSYNSTVYLKDGASTTTTSITTQFGSSTQWIIIDYKGNWSISLQYEGTQTDWCTISENSGSGSKSVWINVLANNASTSRKVTFIITTGSKTNSLTINQLSRSDATNPKGLNWLELPYCEETSTQKFLVHSTTISGSAVRNYTALYDTDNHIPIWVAYPMHKKWISGSGSRTDAWAYDPMLTSSLQLNLEKGMSNGYDRGHMIPSASRLVSNEVNAQTFYYTNMTPQLNGFNAKKWADMESMVRTWAGTGQDTLYVVTGAVLKTIGGNETVKYVRNGNDGKQVAVPNYYYKVLLKRSASGTYKSIGFWFEHKAASGAPTKSDARSVDWIESKTGIDFFTNLPTATQATVEANYTVSDWSGLN